MNDYNKYVGLEYDPYEFNCWHLLKKVLREVSKIELPEFPNTNDLPLCTPLKKPVEGCIALMYSFSTHTANHVGYCINDKQVLHCHGSKPQSLINEIAACNKLFWKVEFYGFNNSSF